MVARKTTNLCLAAFASILVLSSGALAQQAPKANPTPPPEAPTATDLAFLMGTWETQVRINPSELTPEGVKGKGKAEYTLFGQAVEGTRKSETSRGPYEEHELISYDQATKSYQIYAVNLRGHVQTKRLSKNADVWVVEHSGRVGDNDFLIRGKYKIVSPDEIILSSEIDFAKAGFKPFAEVVMKRVHSPK